MTPAHHDVQLGPPRVFHHTTSTSLDHRLSRTVESALPALEASVSTGSDPQLRPFRPPLRQRGLSPLREAGVRRRTGRDEDFTKQLVGERSCSVGGPRMCRHRVFATMIPEAIHG